MLDERGQPLPDTWVQAYNTEYPSSELGPAGSPELTDEDGSFLLRGLFSGRRWSLLPRCALGRSGVVRRLDQARGTWTDGLMSEIGEALIATAVGLLVALPAIAAFNVFRGVPGGWGESGSTRDACAGTSMRWGRRRRSAW